MNQAIEGFFRVVKSCIEKSKPKPNPISKNDSDIICLMREIVGGNGWVLQTARDGFFEFSRNDDIVSVWIKSYISVYHISSVLHVKKNTVELTAHHRKAFEMYDALKKKFLRF